MPDTNTPLKQDAEARRKAKAEYAKARRKANPEKAKTYARAYYAKNREKALARNKAWREVNREKRLAYKKAYHKENIEKERSYRKSYRKANPEKVKALQKVWDLWLRYGITPETWNEWLKKQNGFCPIMGTKLEGGNKTVVHHNHYTNHPEALWSHAANMIEGLLVKNPNPIKALKKLLKYFEESELFHQNGNGDNTTNL